MRCLMIAAGLATLGFFCAACSLHKTYGDPVAVMLDREADLSWRLRAMEQGGQSSPPPPGYESALRELVWSDRHPLELRLAALQRLIDDDADGFWRIADRRLAGVDHMAMLEAICARAAPGNADGRQDAIPALIKSWARPIPDIPDDQRPEYRAILALTGSDNGVGTALAHMLFDYHEEYDLSHEAAAWRVMNRWQSPELSLGIIGTTMQTQGLIGDLKDARKLLDPLPTEPEQIAWLVRLRRERPDDWRAMRDAAETLTMEQREGLHLRHLPAVLRSSREDRSRSREYLKRLLHERFRAVPVTPRGRDIEGEEYVKPMPERFDDHADQLVWGDLVVIEQLLDALTNDALRLTLFELAEADRLDESAEHGGVLTWEPPEPPESDAVVARQYASTLSRHDRVFISSQDLVEAAQLGLAHFHFHAQQHDNAAYAGPGGGDLRFAQRMGFNCIVFTFVNPHTLAADYYQPDGIVIDLGVIHHP